MNGPRLVIARHVAGSALRYALIWGAVFGLFVLATIKAFIAAYPTIAERLRVATSLRSFAVLLGVPRHAETVAGFTSWRVLVVIALIGAIWALLSSTRAFRGDEDAGRWELILAGPVTKRTAALQALAGFAAALGAMFVVATGVTFVAGRTPGANFALGSAALFALAMISGAAMFVAIGALASQLSATRGQAATICAGVLGVSYVVRMVADSSNSTGWLRWLSPIGWIEEMRPLRDPQPLAYAAVALLVATCGAAAVTLAARRDVYASVLRERPARAAAAPWLRGSIALALVLARPSTIGWLGGIAALSFIQGFVARTATTLLSDSPAATAQLGRLGIRKASEGYLGVTFLTMALIIALLAASQIAGIRDEEGSGRVENLVVRPLPRLRWLAERSAIATATVLLGGLAAGLFTWYGAASQRVGVDLGTLLAAGVNATVPALFVLGAGVLTVGLRPRVAAAVSYGLVAWSFLVLLLGSIIVGNDWFKDLSLFAHIELAPASKPDWPQAAAVVAIGLAIGMLGALVFRRRDLEYT